MQVALQVGFAMQTQFFADMLTVDMGRASGYVQRCSNNLSGLHQFDHGSHLGLHGGQLFVGHIDIVVIAIRFHHVLEAIF